MKESLAQILVQLRGMWRFRWTALATAWTVAIVGWTAVVALPNTYESHARVYVDTQSVLKPLLHGLTVNTDVASRVAMMAHIIMGREHLERVARETGVAARASTPEEYQRLIDNLSKQITLTANGNVYSLSYSDHNPEMAQSVVSHLLNTFMEDTLGMKQADAGSAQQFLENQIRDYDARLQTAEHRLADFKQRNVGVMPGEGGDYFSQLQTANDQLQTLQGKLRLAQEERTELKRQLNGEEPTFGLFSSIVGEQQAGGGAFDSEIADDRRQLAKLELQFTDKYPSVIALKAQIAQLEKQRAQALTASAPKVRNSGMAVPRSPAQAAAYQLDLNPVYQDLRVQLSRTEVTIVELQAQVAEQARAIRTLKARVNTIPVVEAQLAQLTRDYTVTKAQYDALLQRLDSARLSQQAEAAHDQLKFYVVEPPVKPLLPFGPKRPLLITLVMVVAIGSGIALAFLFNQLKPVFLSRAMLATITGLPVLGAVTLVKASVEPPLLERESFRVGAGTASLFVIYVLAVALSGLFSRLAHSMIH